MRMEHEETTDEERNVDVVIKPLIVSPAAERVGASLVTASARSAGSIERERLSMYERLGVLLLIDKSSSVNKSTLYKSTRRFEEGTVVVKLLLLSI
jgi:hypothetical protein